MTILLLSWLLLQYHHQFQPWEGEQDKLLPDGDTEVESFQEGNANAMPDTNDKGFQPVLPSTKAGRILANCE